MGCEETSKTTTTSILLVDDYDGNRWMLKDVISDALDVAVEEANSGFHAAEILAKRRFDVIVSDFNMPNGNGQWLLNFIKEQPSRTPMILCSTMIEVCPPPDETLFAVIDKSNLHELVDRLSQLGARRKNG